MNKSILAVLFAFATLLVFAGLGSGGHPDDGYRRDEVSFARRGALGADAYVVTNVVPQMPCYALATGCGTSLVDRAVNECTVTGRVTFALPPIPERRAVDAFRAARAFILVIDAPTNRVPDVSFSGFGRFYTDCGEIDIGRGKTLLSFVEIGDGDFLVESRALTETR